MSDTLRAVGTIFVNNNEEILLLLREGSIPEGGLWGLVGGKIDKNEGKLDAAIREIKEEIGVDIAPSDLKFVKTYTYHWDKGDKKIEFETFKSDFKEGAELSLDTSENVKYMWILPEEAYKRKDLMIGLYKILLDLYNLKEA